MSVATFRNVRPVRTTPEELKRHWIVYETMLSEVRGFRLLIKPTQAQRIMLDLLEAIESVPLVGMDLAGPVLELVQHYMQWKYDSIRTIGARQPFRPES